MKYCIDTSALLDAWQRWYPAESFPTLWERLETLVATGAVISSEEVLLELERKEGDTLYAWALKRQSMFIPLDDAIQQSGSTIMATFPRLVDGRTGKSFADPWVIATAHVHEAVVVTGEAATRALNRPKIPDVCHGMGIQCMRMPDLIRSEGWRF